jgi:hypothetical protein
MPTYRNGTPKYKHHSRRYHHESSDESSNRTDTLEHIEFVQPTRKHVILRCGHCRKDGHNIRTCEIEKQSRIINHFDKEYYEMVNNLYVHTPCTTVGFERILKFYRKGILSTSSQPVAFAKYVVRNSRIYQFKIIDPRLICSGDLSDWKKWKTKYSRQFGDLLVEYYTAKGINI